MRTKLLEVASDIRGTPNWHHGHVLGFEIPTAKRSQCLDRKLVANPLHKYDSWRYGPGRLCPTFTCVNDGPVVVGRLHTRYGSDKPVPGAGDGAFGRYRGVSRLTTRPAILAATVLFGFLALARLGVLATILVLALGVVAAVVLPRRPGRKANSGAVTAGKGWRPSVQHAELPVPTEDPVIEFHPPTIEDFAAQRPPLASLGLSAGLRGQLDGYALGRAKRILEAPDLLNHAAADPESWPKIETAVNTSLNLLTGQGVEFVPAGANRLKQALALCAAQGVLLAEWRQLEDGKTNWAGAAARVRASDPFSIERIAETMKRQLLPDLFAGISRRPAGFEIALLVPFTLSTAFYLRLSGEPPKAFAA